MIGLVLQGQSLTNQCSGPGPTRWPPSTVNDLLLCTMMLLDRRTWLKCLVALQNAKLVRGILQKKLES